MVCKKSYETFMGFDAYVQSTQERIYLKKENHNSKRKLLSELCLSKTISSCFISLDTFCSFLSCSWEW